MNKVCFVPAEGKTNRYVELMRRAVTAELSVRDSIRRGCVFCERQRFVLSRYLC